ncbi:MAG: NAD(P)-dependent oxidoreductase [Patescibacteria group bacterium]|nr:NAD(P)-dependent oxidoreductase [Patescibacteria group bacterium]
MKVLFFYNEDWEKDYFGENIGSSKPAVGQEDFEVEFIKGRVQDFPELKNEEAGVLSVFVGSHVDGAVFDRFPNVKYIAARSTGFDNIDIEEAKKRGIIVSNVPAYGSVTVAEFTFALLLSVSRKIFPAYDQILERGSFKKDGLRGFDLNGKTLGVVGVGKIGLNAIKIANGFGMKVIAFDKNPDEELSKSNNFEYVELDELLKQADVISLHVPYNPHTHHLLDKESFEKMKKGVVIINTSRGGIIETQALVEALKNGVVAGAGLDVLEAEIYMGKGIEALQEEKVSDDNLETVLHNKYLIEHPSVVITPHNAFNTQEAIERIFDVTVDNIKNFAGGKIENEV